MSVARLLAVVAVLMLLEGCGQTGRDGAKGVNAAPNAGVQSGKCPVRATLEVSRVVRVGAGAGAVAVGANAVWVARTRVGTVTRVAGADRSVLRVGATPISLATAGDRLWVAERDENKVVSIDTTSLVRATSSSVDTPVSVVAGSSGIWALSLDAGALYRLDPANGVAGEAIDSPVADPSDMVLVGEDVWILGAGKHGLSPVNASLERIVRAGFDEPAEPLSGLSGADGTLWIGEPAKRSLLSVDAQSVSVRLLAAPDRIMPVATAVGACGVWVAGTNGELVLANARTAEPLGPPIRVGHAIADLATAGAGVWATDPVDGTLVHVDIHPAS